MTGRGPDPDLFRRAESAATKAFSLTDDPPVLVAGDGVRLTAADGRRYLDFATGSGVSNVGHGNAAVGDAVRAQLGTGLTHVGPHFHTAAQAAFYAALLERTPPGLAMLHPATNGTEATEAALKACMHATGARTFLAFSGGYHGRTFGALAVSEAKGANAGLGPFAPAAEFVPYPRAGAGGAEAVANAVRAIADRPGSAPPLAGVVVEPVQATAGVLIPPAGFLARLADAARRASVPLVVDEVFTGFGRTGRLFACDAEEVSPDLLLMGKAMGGGFPGGLVAGRPEILSVWPRGAQSSTFQLHPVTAAAALASLREIESRDLPANAREIGERMQTLLPSLLVEPLAREFRGAGAMWGLEIRGADATSSRRNCRAVRLAALRRGLLTWECGRDAEVVGLMPPLTASAAEVDEACAILLDSLREAAGTVDRDCSRD